MKLESKYFDAIRIAQRKDEVEPERVPTCQWKGCGCPGTHKAPRDRGRDGRYWRFCIDHVRQFNASYNYFAGMSDDEIEAFQKSAVIGHRPTWRLGDNGTAARRDEAGPGAGRWGRPPDDADDPHDVLGRQARGTGAGRSGEAGEAPRRALKTLERKALDQLHLPEFASKAEIKSRFKELVKRHHPDANGGDRGSEERLREIIQAYNYLKAAGLV